MPFDWEKYSLLADGWKASADEELLRCSVSRAYYGFYHKVRIFKSIQTQKQQHSVVRVALISSGDTIETNIAKYLKDLQDDRELADYDGVKPVNARFVQGFFIRLNKAQELLASIQP